LEFEKKKKKNSVNINVCIAAQLLKVKEVKFGVRLISHLEYVEGYCRKHLLVLHLAGTYGLSL